MMTPDEEKPADPFDPKRITALLEGVHGNLFEPMIRKVADELYCSALEAAQDYLLENLDSNLSQHVYLLERENQRMRTELWDVDVELVGFGLSSELRVETIKKFRGEQVSS